MGQMKIKGKTLKQHLISFAQQKDAAICHSSEGDGLQLVQAYERSNGGRTWIVSVDSRINFREADEDLVEMLFDIISQTFGDYDDEDEDKDIYEDDDEQEPNPYSIDSFYFFGHCYYPLVNFGIGKDIDLSKYITFGEETNSIELIESICKRRKIEKWKVAEQLSYHLQEAADDFRLQICQSRTEQHESGRLPSVNRWDGFGELYLESFILWQQK